MRRAKAEAKRRKPLAWPRRRAGPRRHCRMWPRTRRSSRARPGRCRQRPGANRKPPPRPTARLGHARRPRPHPQRHRWNGHAQHRHLDFEVTDHRRAVQLLADYVAADALEHAIRAYIRTYKGADNRNRILKSQPVAGVRFFLRQTARVISRRNTMDKAIFR